MRMYQLKPISPTPLEKLSKEIEHTTKYTLDNCELNIFETHKSAEGIILNFEGFTITSMLRGKKILRESDNSISYSPGETFILPSTQPMVIDFPEAGYGNPTQCTALILDNSYLNKQLDFINENYQRHKEDNMNWDLSSTKALLQNNEQVSNLGNQLIQLFSSNEPLKNILVDIKLKELVLTVMQLQNYSYLLKTPIDKSDNIYVNERFFAVIEFIRQNISSDFKFDQLSKIACMSKSSFYRTFMQEFGVSPSQLILRERINQAKILLATSNIPIKEVGYACGFSDPNYFSRAFKLLEGVSPSVFLNKQA